MCGILGGNNPDWDYDGAVSTMHHRGPNGQRVKKWKDMALGFTRLSVIDLSESAMQPMLSSDGRYAIVFNGEIYDYKKNRQILEKKGYHFRTQSDTEVLLYAFVEWQEKMVDHFDGIFAFAVYDTVLEKVFLCRDRCGVKPLYYFFDGRNFAFASELKAICKLCKNIRFQIDETALYDYHTYLYIPDPKTMYRNVFKLKAAGYLVYDVKKRKIGNVNSYWKVRLNTKEGNKVSKKQLEQKAEELRFHLGNVVARQTVADVPVGTFLSGGVDSSIITAEASKYVKDVTSYTIGFPDVRYDESGYARTAADMLHVKLKTKQFEDRDYTGLYDRLPDIYDEPFADTSAFPTYFVSEFAKEDITVVLTGDGGDELFGGYSRYIYAGDLLDKQRNNKRALSELYLRWRNRISLYQEYWDGICLEDVAKLAPLYQYRIKPDRKGLREKYHIPKDYDDFWYYRKYYHKELPPLTRLRYLDFMTYLNGDLLTKVDRASMHVSLEARVPFLDREIVDYAFSLTQEECNPSGELKGLLKYAYEDVFPRSFLNRRKQGFSIPFSFLRNEKSPQEHLIETLWKL